MATTQKCPIAERIFIRRFSRVVGARLDAASNWKTLDLRNSRYPACKLRDICEINPGTNLDDLDDKDEVSFVPMEAVSEIYGSIVESLRRPISECKSYTVFQEGDVLWAKITPCMENGKAAIAKGLHNAFGFGSTEFHVLRPSASIEAGYLLALVRSEIFREHARLNFTGTSGHQRVDEDFLKKLNLSLPPPEVQKKIVSSLNAAQNKKHEKDLQASQLLESIDALLLNELGIKLKPSAPSALKNRIFRRAFSAVTGNRLDPLYHHGDMFHFVRAAKCKLAPLGNCVTTFLTGFAAGRNDQGDEEGGIIQIRPTNLSDDRELVFHRNVYIARDELKQRPFDVLQRREVLFNNTNSQEQVGKTTFFDLDGEFFCSNHVTRIATDENQLDPQFLGYVLNLYQRQQVFYKLATNWNNQSGVGVDVLEKIPIPLPDLKRQTQIVQRLEKVRIDAHALRRQAAAELSAAKKEIEAMILGKGDKT